MDEENKFTDEFKTIIDNYKKQIKPNKSEKLNIHMILEARNKINIDLQNEDEILKEDLIKDKVETGSLDNMINQRMKMEEMQQLNNKKKKMRKDNIIRLLKGNKIKLQNNEIRRSTIILPKISTRETLIVSPNKNEKKLTINSQLKKMKFIPFVQNNNKNYKTKCSLDSIQAIATLNNPSTLDTIVNSYSNFDTIKSKKFNKKDSNKFKSPLESLNVSNRSEGIIV